MAHATFNCGAIAFLWKKHLRGFQQVTTQNDFQGSVGLRIIEIKSMSGFFLLKGIYSMSIGVMN